VTAGKTTSFRRLGQNILHQSTIVPEKDQQMYTDPIDKQFPG
jgi:hypothetical protein